MAWRIGVSQKFEESLKKHRHEKELLQALDKKIIRLEETPTS